MATDIIQTAPNTYTATIDGTVWLNITPASRLYEVVQEAISGGAVVTQAE